MDGDHRMSRSPGQAEYQGLVYSIVRLSGDAKRGVAIGVTSPHKGAGTSFVVHGLVQQLGGDPANRVLRVDLASVAWEVQSLEDLLTKITPTSQEGIFEICQTSGTDQMSHSSAFWHASAAGRQRCIEALRDRFQYLIFDCPALQVSGDALAIAAILDGFLLVIEANKTTTEEILEAERQIEGAGGQLYGSILNKQKSLLPRWARGR